MRLWAMMTIGVLMASCGKSGSGDGAIVPRQKAYPRIEIADSVFTAYDNLPLHLQVNDAAVAELTRSDAAGSWIDVNYPRYGVSLHYTFTPVNPSTVDEVMDNRIERIALNIGSNDAEMISLSSPEGIDAQVFVARNGVTTPVQFLATDHQSVVVSGVAFIPVENKESGDSLRPVVDMLSRDVIHSLVTLKK